jgi:hypothetical protein
LSIFFIVDLQVRLANRTRQGLRPAEPSGMDFGIEYDHVPTDFLQADVTNHGRRHLIFATNEQLRLLSQSKTWYVDATFYVVKTPFTQLFSVHAFLREDNVTKQVPLAFALMSGKKKSDYKKVTL